MFMSILYWFWVLALYSYWLLILYVYSLLILGWYSFLPDSILCHFSMCGFQLFISHYYGYFLLIFWSILLILGYIMGAFCYPISYMCTLLILGSSYWSICVNLYLLCGDIPFLLIIHIMFSHFCFLLIHGIQLSVFIFYFMIYFVDFGLYSWVHLVNSYVSSLLILRSKLLIFTSLLLIHYGVISLFYYLLIHLLFNYMWFLSIHIILLCFFLLILSFIYGCLICFIYVYSLLFLVSCYLFLYYLLIRYV